MNAVERSSHPSQPQIEALLEFLERHPGLAKGFSKVASARDAARKQWERLAVQLNSMGGSAKSWKQWTKYWADKKSSVKKKAAQRYALRHRTGGGMEQVVELTEVEERIVALLGGESFAIGDRHLAINPFDEPQSNMQESPRILTETVAESTVTVAEADNMSVNTSTSQIYILPHILSNLHSPPRTPPNVNEVTIQTTPSRQGVHPRATSPAVEVQQQQHIAESPRRQQQLHVSTPRRRRVRSAIPPSPPSQRRTQLASLAERFLRIEEERLQLERRSLSVTEILADLATRLADRDAGRDAAMAQAMTTMGEGMQLLAEVLNRRN